MVCTKSCRDCKISTAYSLSSRGESVITYQELAEWVYNNYNLDDYFVAEDLIYDVKQRFNRDQMYFPIQAEDNIKAYFDHRRELKEMEERQAEQQQIADYLGSGEIQQSIPDQVIEEMQKPEIMGIDFSQYATTKESVLPPQIEKFQKPTQSGLGTITNSIRGFFRRILGR